MKFDLKFILLVALVFASRLFFINTGFGVEEDAWGYGLNALLMAKTGIYEYSRLPGHPVLEYIYCFLPLKEAWLFNLCTAGMSTLAVVIFYLICKKLKTDAFAGALLLTFTPVFYVNSSNAMDYNWALCFMLAAFYFMIRHKKNTSALMIALAVGSRITSGGILLPLSIYLYMMEKKDPVKVIRYVATTLLLCLLVFSPVIIRYGMSFLGYVNQFGYPPLIKSLFKASIGVWGLLGLIMVVFLFVKAFKNYSDNNYERKYKPALLVCLSTIGLFFLSYAYEPHKAAYLICIVPFVILFIIMLTENKKLVYAMLSAFIISCFFIGINLADDNRSSPPSKLAYVTTINKQKVAFDLLRGNVTDDYDKRLVRMNYVSDVIAKAVTLPGKNVIICGYWLNNVLMQQQGHEKQDLMYLHYIDEKLMQDLKAKNFTIYIIPGQQIFNDQCYKGNFTDLNTKPLFQ